jgi:hypothetical protein
MNDKTETKRLAEAAANLAATITEIIDLKLRALIESRTATPECGGINRLTPAEGWVSKKAAAAHLKITPRTLDNWMKRGLVPYVHIGRNVRFKLNDVDETLNRRLRMGARF